MSDLVLVDVTDRVATVTVSGTVAGLEAVGGFGSGRIAVGLQAFDDGGGVIAGVRGAIRLGRFGRLGRRI